MKDETDLMIEGRLPGDPEMDCVEVLEKDDLDSEADSKPIKAPHSPSSILEGWVREGPLAHQRTGHDELDEATGGGPVYGTRWYIVGAPDAAKTLLLVDLLHRWSQLGISVGLLAVDEEPSDILTRLAQRVGIDRADCEARGAGVLDALRREVCELPFRFYDGAWSIEAAAENLASSASGRAALGIDSIQTAKCEVEISARSEMTMSQAVEARVRAVRTVASDYRLITLATSELGRAHYRSRKNPEDLDAMAGAKWSSSVEFSARVLLSLKSVPGIPNKVSVEIVKNKHGRSRTLANKDALYMNFDRHRQTIDESSAPELAENEGRDVAAREAVVRDAGKLALIVAKQPGLTSRDLWSLLKASTGISRGRGEAARSCLGDAVLRRSGSRRAEFHFLDGSKVPEDVLAHIPDQDRPLVVGMRPPKLTQTGNAA